MLEKIKNIDFSTLAFCLYLIKTIVLPIGVADSFIMIGLSGLYGYNLLIKAKHQLNLNQAVLQKINNLESRLNMITTNRGLKTERDNEQKRFF